MDEGYFLKTFGGNGVCKSLDELAVRYQNTDEWCRPTINNEAIKLLEKEIGEKALDKRDSEQLFLSGMVYFREKREVGNRA